jgi:hypothetical protein
MTEENKIIARRVYEIISTGDLDRAGEIVDPEAPDNELLSDDSSFVNGVGLAVDGAKAAGVFNADRYRMDFQLME